MRHSSCLALAAVLVLSGTGAVLAQSGNQQYGQGGPLYGAPQSNWGNSHSAPQRGGPYRDFDQSSNQGSWSGPQASSESSWSERQGGSWGNQPEGWNHGRSQANWYNQPPGSGNWSGRQRGGDRRYGQYYGPGPQVGQNRRFGQDKWQENRNQQLSQDRGQGGRSYGQADVSGSLGSRFQQRSALRRQLRQVGFQQVRILDAAYLVQASTPDGRTVLMIVDPSSQTSGSGNAETSQSRNSGNGQIFGSLENQLDQSAISSQHARGSSDQGFMSQKSYLNEDDQGRMAQSETGSIGQSGTGGMNADQVRSMLQDRGYSKIENLEREGGTFTASADWQGEQVDVSVNARTGEITEPASL